MTDKQKQLVAEAAAKCGLQENATYEQAVEALKAARSTTNTLLEELGVDPSATPADRLSLLEANGAELADAIKRLSEKIQEPLQRRALEIHSALHEGGDSSVVKMADIMHEAPTGDYEKELHRLQDAMHWVGALSCGINWDAVEGRGGRLTESEKQALHRTKVYSKLRNHIARGPYDGLKDALNTGSDGGGADYVFTALSPTMFNQVNLKPGVSDFVRVIAMTSGPSYRVPFDPGDAMTYIASETTADWGTASAPTKSTATTDDRTMTAKLHFGLIDFSGEWEEDAVFPVVPWLNEKGARAIRLGRDDILLNGDTTSSHMDSDVTSSADRRKLAIGVRKTALAASAAVDLATIGVSAYLQMLRLAGVYADDEETYGLWAANSAGHNDMLKLADVATMERYGSDAVIRTGRLEQLLGYPVIKSRHVRRGLNATGVVDGSTTTKTCTLWFNRDAWVFGSRREYRVKVVDAPWAIEQRAVYVSERIALKRIQDAGADGSPAVIGYNQTTA